MDFVALFEEFFTSYVDKEVSAVASTYPEVRSISIDYSKLLSFNHELAEALLEEPDEVLSKASIALRNLHFLTPALTSFEPNIRFYNIPEVSSTLALKLGSEHLNKLASVEGVINLVTEIKPRLQIGTFQCEHCHLEHRIEQDRFKQKKPFSCQCGRRDFKLLESESVFVNLQRAQLQDLIEKTKGNVSHNFIELYLEDDLVNRVAPGERVVVVGTLRLREAREKNGPGKSSVFEKFFEVIHLQRSEKEFEELEVSKEEEEKIKELSKDPALFDKIVASIAPSIYGHSKIKEAICLQLFGGTPNKVLPDGKQIRSDIHAMLVGDPGTAKSTLMRYVAELAPKSIFVSGESSSGAGLTAAAERDELGGWTLKAGALVLASGGIVLIDEFDKMRKEDMGSMHTALEQQTLNVAKAGIVAEFKTKTAVLAAANPKFGRFDPNQPVFSQFDIKPPLLSRFDLIFTIKDVLDEKNDQRTADHILTAHKYSSETSGKDIFKKIMPVIPVDFLRKYIAHARKSVMPRLSEVAADKIKDYYLSLRRMGAQQNTFTVTARQIEGIIRLSEACAKVRLSKVVEIQDAQRAIELADFVLKEVFVDKETGRIDSDVVNIGIAKSKQDKIKVIQEIINNLSAQFDLIKVDDIIREADAAGIEEAKARDVLSALKDKGDIFEPRPGHYKKQKGVR